MTTSSGLGQEYFPANKPWVESPDGLRLIGGRCPACDARTFPRQGYCNACDTDASPVPVELAPRGTLYTFSRLHVGPGGFPAPRLCGYVDLDDGVRLYGQINAEEVSIGQRLGLELAQVRTLNDGRAIMSYRFRKVD